MKVRGVAGSLWTFCFLVFLLSGTFLFAEEEAKKPGQNGFLTLEDATRYLDDNCPMPEALLTADIECEIFLDHLECISVCYDHYIYPEGAKMRNYTCPYSKGTWVPTAPEECTEYESSDPQEKQSENSTGAKDATISPPPKINSSKAPPSVQPRRPRGPTNSSDTSPSQMKSPKITAPVKLEPSTAMETLTRALKNASPNTSTPPINAPIKTTASEDPESLGSEPSVTLRTEVAEPSFSSPVDDNGARSSSVPASSQMPDEKLSNSPFSETVNDNGGPADLSSSPKMESPTNAESESSSARKKTPTRSLKVVSLPGTLSNPQLSRNLNDRGTQTGFSNSPSQEMELPTSSDFESLAAVSTRPLKEVTPEKLFIHPAKIADGDDEPVDFFISPLPKMKSPAPVESQSSVAKETAVPSSETESSSTKAERLTRSLKSPLYRSYSHHSSKDLENDGSLTTFFLSPSSYIQLVETVATPSSTTIQKRPKQSNVPLPTEPHHLYSASLRMKGNTDNSFSPSPNLGMRNVPIHNDTESTESETSQQQIRSTKPFTISTPKHLRQPAKSHPKRKETTNKLFSVSERLETKNGSTKISSIAPESGKFKKTVSKHEVTLSSSPALPIVDDAPEFIPAMQSDDTDTTSGRDSRACIVQTEMFSDRCNTKNDVVICMSLCNPGHPDGHSILHYCKMNEEKWRIGRVTSCREILPLEKSLGKYYASFPPDIPTDADCRYRSYMNPNFCNFTDYNNVRTSYCTIPCNESTIHGESRTYLCRNITERWELVEVAKCPNHANWNVTSLENTTPNPCSINLIADGMLACHDVQSNSIAQSCRISCSENYVLMQPARSTAVYQCCKSGKWTSPLPFCVLDASMIPAFARLDITIK